MAEAHAAASTNFGALCSNTEMQPIFRWRFHAGRFHRYSHLCSSSRFEKAYFYFRRRSFITTRILILRFGSMISPPLSSLFCFHSPAELDGDSFRDIHSFIIYWLTSGRLQTRLMADDFITYRLSFDFFRLIISLDILHMRLSQALAFDSFDSLIYLLSNQLLNKLTGSRPYAKLPKAFRHATPSRRLDDDTVLIWRWR